MEPYIPQTLPIDVDWIRHVPLIGKANRALARYDGLLQGIVHPEILLAPLTIREAVLSSRIEGTQASLEDVLEFQAQEKYETEKQKDIQEIINYRLAMNSAIELFKNRPLTINMICELHRILLTSVRGRDREPGKVRRLQNYMAPAGTSIERAIFIPPAPRDVMGALTNWKAISTRVKRSHLSSWQCSRPSLS